MKRRPAALATLIISLPAGLASGQYTDLQAVSLTAPSGPFYPGDSVLVGYETRNNGPLVTLNYTVRIYASLDTTIDPADALLTEFDRDPLPPGTSYTGLALGDLPWGLPSGTYYIGMRLVYLFDSTPNNNTAYDASPVTVQELSDLRLSFLGYPVTSLYQGQSKTVSCTIRNQGPGDCPGYAFRFYISPDGFVSAGDREVLTLQKGFMANGAEENLQVPVPIPADLTPGSWYIGAIIDYPHDSFYPNNDKTGVADFIVSGAPDLDVLSLILPTNEYVPGATADTSVAVKNVGEGRCYGYTAAFYASRDPVINEEDEPLGSVERGDSLEPGATDSFAHGLALPNGLGAWFLGIIVTPSYDRNEADNTDRTPFSIVHPPLRLTSMQRITATHLRICWTSYACDSHYRVLASQSADGPFNPVQSGITSTPPENCANINVSLVDDGFFRIATEP